MYDRYIYDKAFSHMYKIKDSDAKIEVFIDFEYGKDYLKEEED